MENTTPEELIPLRQTGTLDSTLVTPQLPEVKTVEDAWQLHTVPHPQDVEGNNYPHINVVGPAALIQQIRDIRDQVEQTDFVLDQLICNIVENGVNHPDLNGDWELMGRIKGMIQVHLEKFPNAPTEGFETFEDYIAYQQEMNAILNRTKAIYDRNPEDYYDKDPENPQKVLSRALFECADGRNHPFIFLKGKHLINSFALEWMPVAGLIIFPEIKEMEPAVAEAFHTALSTDTLSTFLAKYPTYKELFFHRLDLMAGAKVKRFLERKNPRHPKIHKFDFEFQSHLETQNPNHGCGAHGSDFNKAQMETIMDCFITREWLQDRYPLAMSKQAFRVYRTTHDNGEGGHVYTGTFMDKHYVQSEFKKEHQAIFNKAKELFEPPLPQRGTKAAWIRQWSVVRQYVGNHLSVNVNKHDEQVIRVSNTHFAHTMIGQSVLEISWTDKPEIIIQHLKVLLGIVEKNYRAKRPSNPAILHLDIPKGQEDIREVYEQVIAGLQADPEIRERRSSLHIYATETDPQSYVAEEILRV